MKLPWSRCAAGFLALHLFAGLAIAEVEFATEKLRIVTDKRGSLSSLYDIPRGDWQGEVRVSA